MRNENLRHLPKAQPKIMGAGIEDPNARIALNMPNPKSLSLSSTLLKIISLL